MADQSTSSFTIAIDDFDKSLLPARARVPGTDAFNTEVTKLLQMEYSAFGGWARIVVSDKVIQVTWRQGDDDPLTQALDNFQQGDYPRGISMLRALLRQKPTDTTILYNLGMALSDMGALTEAEQLLRQVVETEPTNVNALVALGVAQQRQKRTNAAIDTLRTAVSADEENPWAHRNLGACLLSVGQNEAANKHLRRATDLNSDDQQAWYGLGQSYESLDDPKSADECYERTIKLDPDSQIAELAKQRRSQIGQAEMRVNGA